MKRIPKRTVALSGCVGLICLLLVGMARLMHLPSSPLDHAQAIAKTTAWQALNHSTGFPNYYWSGTTDLTYVSTGTDRTQHLFRRSTMTTGNTFEKEGAGVQLRNGRYAGELSPNGKWFVEWHQNKLRQNVPTFVATDSSLRTEGEPSWGHDSLWTQSSDALLSSVWRKAAAIDRYIPDTGERQKIDLPALKTFYEAVSVDSSGHMIGVEGGNVILHYDKSIRIPSRNYPNIKVARIDLSHPDSKPEQWTIPVPKEIDFGFCFFSPSGDRVLWVVYGDTTPALLRMLRQHVPGMSESPEPGYRWLVSGIHGEDMHEIASYQYRSTQTTGYVREPYSRPRWMPDGKHISFIYQNTLYTRPTE